MTREKEFEIIKAIQSDNSKIRNQAIDLLYRGCYRRIESFIKKNSGTKFEARDIFQEGIMILYQNIKKNKFRGESSIITYLHSICRNLWFQQLKQHPMSVIDDFDENTLSFEVVQEEQINVHALKMIMSELNDDCIKILTGFYYEMKSMKQLSSLFKLGSEQAAKNKKSRCLKHLSEMIRIKGLAYDNFIQ